jgi:hypothetical protein
MEKTDSELREIRNLGRKSLDEISAIFPYRAKTYEDEPEILEARRRWRKTDVTARRILRFMEYNNMTLWELLASGTTVGGRSKARQILTEYCVVFPERIDDVLNHFEAMNDTSDRFYTMLKLTRYRKLARLYRLAE